MTLRSKTALLVAIAASLLLLGAAQAAAAPVLDLELHHGPSNFAPGGGPGEVQVSTETPGGPSTNEVQLAEVFASGGRFRLGFDGETTADIDFDASAAQVKGALEALPSIGAGDVGVEKLDEKVVYNDYNIFEVTFQNALGDADVPQLTWAQGAEPLVIHPELWFEASNLGPDPTTGTLTLTVVLPNGITLEKAAPEAGGDRVEWSCPGVPGDSTVTCTTDDPLPRLSASTGLVIHVRVDPGLPPGIDRFVRAQVSGGAAAAPSPQAFEQIRIDDTPAAFEILPETFLPELSQPQSLAVERRAGARPGRLAVPFDFTTVDGPFSLTPLSKEASGNIRNLVVDLPPGFLGDPTAAGECEAAELILNKCEDSTQVGLASVKTPQFLEPTHHFSVWASSVYNMSAPFGTLTDLAFVIAGNPIHVEAELNPARGYAVRTTVSDINETLPPFHQKLTVWGVPADPAHDPERCDNFKNGPDTSSECPSDGPLKPFLTVPFECGVEMSMRLHSYDSWQNTGDFGPPIEHDLGQFTDCGDVPFEPSVSVAPTTDAADSPSGLDVAIELPQDNSCEQIEPAPPAGEPQLDCPIATSPLKDATVKLPEGLTVNAAGANGLAGCSEAEIGLGTDDPVRCPNGSKVADVEVTTPLLPDPVGGVVYLATPHANSFNTLLAGYIVLEDVSRGLLVKIPGRIEVEEGSGQLTGIFTDNPQLPFSKFELHFKGGAHSTLVTPPTCGTYTADAEFTPWSGTGAVKPSSSFEISGGGCAGTEAEMPHSPGFDAGSESPIAGQHSPFVIDLRRDDGSQRFKEVTVKPPPGLVAKLAGAETCSDGALAAAASKSGRDEQSSPSCPVSSRIGTVHAAAGAGPSPYWAPGTAYLAGPYKGAPVSIAIITPAVAGPFDLGTIVVRSAVQIDPTTAEITAVSDPIPTSLEGIPLDVRRAIVRLDKPDFTLNGTSCNPFAVTGTLVSTLGQSAGLHNRFQLGECRRLGFKPRVALQLFGGVKRGKYQGLKAVVRPRPGDANISSAVVRFPRSAFVAQEHIRTVCTRVQWAADACPPGSVYGKAIARTPLLDYPLEGNVYLRSSDNDLPDAVADFRGPAHQPIRFELAIANDSVKGALRNRVTTAPDVPVSYFRLQLFGGKKGLIINSRNICRSANRATAALRAHNGRGSLQRVALFNRKCKVLRKRAKKRRAAKRRAHKRKAAAQRGGRSR